MNDEEPDSDQHFEGVVDTLAERFAGVHDGETVARVVQKDRSS